MAKKLLVDIEARDNASHKIKNLTKELNTLNRAYKVSQDTLKKEGDAYKTLQGIQDHYSRSNELLKEKLKQQLTIAQSLQKERHNEIKALKDAENNLVSYQNKFTKNKELIESTKVQLRNYCQEHKRLSDSYKEEEKRLNELTSFKKKLQNENKELKKSIDSLTISGRKNSEEYKRQKEVLENNKNVLKTVNYSIDEHKNKLNNLSNSLRENGTAHKELRKTINDRLTTENKLVNEIDKHKKSIDKNKDSHNKLKNEIKLTRVEIDNCTASQRKANDEYRKDAIKKQIEQAKEYREQLLKNAETYNKVGNALLKLSAPGLMFAGFGIKEAINFESAFAGVRKTVDATDKQFEKLKDTITKMSERLPQSASQIAGVMEMSGQLGIGIDNIEQFSEVMIKLGDSTNLASEEAAKMLAQYTNITGMDKSNIERLASTIVDLGNNTATTEADIVSMMHALAGMGANFKLTDEQIAGISATLSSVGIASEKGGTAMSKFMMQVLGAGGRTGAEFRKMGKEAGLTEKEIKEMADESSTKLNNFANVAGISAQKFKELSKNNPSEALRLVVEGLGKMKDSGQDISTVLDTLGIKEVRLRDTVMRLAGGHKELTKNLQISKKAWEENTALENEAQKRYQTTESQLKMLKNQFSNVAREVAVQLIPVLINLMKNAKNFLNTLRNMDAGTKKMLLTITALIAGAGGFLKVLGYLNKFQAGLKAVSLALGGIKAKIFKSELEKMTTSTVSAGTSMGGLVGKIGLLNPATVALTGVITAGFLAWRTYSAVLKENSQTILDAKENMGFFDKIVNHFTKTTKKTTKELEEQGYKFSSTGNLSTEFAKKVETAREKTGRLALELESLSKSEFKLGKYDSISREIDKSFDSAIQAINSKKDEVQKSMRDAFNRDGFLSEEEKKTLEWLTKDANTQIESLNKLENDKNDIIKKANDEKRNLTQEEQKKIQEILKETNKIELNSRAKTQEDLLYMQKKFVNEFGNLDLEGQSKMLQERKAQSDKEIADIKAFWDAKIETAKEKAKELTGAEKEEAELAIKTMEETRNIELESAKKHYNDLLEAVKEKYPEIAKEIDEINGKILTNQDKSNVENFNKYREHLYGLGQVNKDGWYQIYNDTTQTYDNMYVKVDETTGKVVGVFNQSTGEIKASTKEQEEALNSVMNTNEFVALNISQSIQNLANSGNKHWSAYKAAIETSGGSVRELGKDADGTRRMLVKLGNEEIVVQVDKSGAVSNLNEVNRKCNALDGKTVQMTIHVGAAVSGVAGEILSGRYLHKASGTNYLTGYASGTSYLPSYANGGMVRSRVNEMGFELFDFPRGTIGYMLGTNRGDDIMDLPVGTKITNHIASTQLMINEIKREVKRQTQPLYRYLDNFRGNTREKVIKQEVTVKFENVTIRDDRDIKKIMQEMRYELNKEVY